MKTAGKLIIGLLAFSAIGFGAWAVVQYRKLMDFCFNFVGYRLLNISLKNVQFEVTLSIKNKSNLPLNIASYNFDVYINNRFATKVSSAVSVTIRPQSFTDFPILVEANFKEVFKSITDPSVLAGLITDFSQVKIRMKGYVTTTGLKNLPIDIEMTLAEMMPDSENPSPPCK